MEGEEGCGRSDMGLGGLAGLISSIVFFYALVKVFSIGSRMGIPDPSLGEDTFKSLVTLLIYMFFAMTASLFTYFILV